MAEGLVGSVFGEEEKPEIEADEGALCSASGAEAFAAAVAAIASRQDPQVAQDTSVFLKKQARLLDIQASHLQDEHALRLQHLRNLLSEESVRRLGLRLRVAFQLFLAATAAAFAIGAAILLHDAVTSEGVVIDRFDTPASLEPGGITGKTVAGALRDQLHALHTSTRTPVASRELSGDWGEEIKLEIPEVGISIGEVSRMLKARFGHDLHVGGDLLQTTAGQIALTVRSSHFDSKTFSGELSDWKSLMTQAAEYVYSHAEPVRWAYYLTNSGRDQEAVDFSRNMFATADKPVRPFLLHTWGNAARDLGDLKQSVRLDRAAIQLKPDYWDAHHNLQLALADLGDEEGAWRAGEEMRHVAGVRPGKVPEDDYLIYDTVTWNLNASLQYIVHDADATGGVGTRTTGVGLLIADLQINLHDVKAAELTLQTVKPDPTDKEIAVMSHFEKGRLGMETGDVGLAANEMDAFISKFTDPAVINDNFGAACYAAPAAEAAGRRDRADEILRTAGRFVDCYRFRGDILDNRNDWTGAQKAYAEAVALAPDLPAPYYSWGMALARHHDLIGSLAKLQAAHHRGPGWADPLKSMGDVLVQQGNRPAALAKYDEAIRLAPAWNQLRLARESIVHR